MWIDRRTAEVCRSHLYGCNMSATLGLAACRRRVRARHLARCAVTIALCALLAARATAQCVGCPGSDVDRRPSVVAQESPNPSLAPKENRVASVAGFLLGGAAGLGLHEAGHLLFDAALGVEPEWKAVHFGPIPFFAISHRAGLPAREEFVISSAGFWMQHVSSEILLSRHPNLARERSPVRKGLLAFNVLASVAYGAAAMAKAGPAERDTRSMADSLGVDERWIAALVLTPALLDAWRYFHPDSAWARWLSRGVKVGGVLLVLR
ncbi:MAG: hypothetical protein ACM3NQ_02275 [Bacteroidales bacterium]